MFELYTMILDSDDSWTDEHCCPCCRADMGQLTFGTGAYTNVKKALNEAVVSCALVQP